jgi:hypothetical protein
MSRRMPSRTVILIANEAAMSRRPPKAERQGSAMTGRMLAGNPAPQWSVRRETA